MRRFFKHRRRFMVAALGLLTFGLVGACHRHSWHDADRAAEMAERIADRISDKLDLDEGQQERTRELTLEIIESAKTMRSHRKEMAAELENQFKNQKFDEAALNSLADRSEKDLHNFRMTLVSKLSEFHSLLNEEQRQEAAELMGKFRDRFEQ